MYKVLCGLMFLFLLGFYLGDELLGLMVTQCVTFWGTARLFPTVARACFLNSKEKKFFLVMDFNAKLKQIQIMF